MDTLAYSLRGLIRQYRKILAASMLVAVALGTACSEDPSGGSSAIHVVQANGNIGPVIARFIDRAIDNASEKQAEAVVIQLDTPGGLSTSMDDIVQDVLTADLPVVVYVYPPGGRAASAGTLITLAGHIAVMAPGTSIGAATPVSASGDDIGDTLEDKAINDASARFRDIAEQRGRNGDWAEKSVRESASIGAAEAVELGVVDLVAPNMATLLQDIDGRQVELHNGVLATLETAGAPSVEVKLNFGERLLEIISDPNITFLLISLGSVALFFELANPGTIFPGVFGVIALFLGFFGLSVIPFDWAGIGLILAAFALFFLELAVTSGGILAVGGVVALILGGILLTSGNPEGFEVSRWLVFGLSSVMGAFSLLLLRGHMRARRLGPAVGTETMVGQRAVTSSNMDPKGYVLFEGEYWIAESDEPVKSGTEVVITKVEGLRLRVSKAKE